jgi:hypothetical protein
MHAYTEDFRKLDKENTGIIGIKDFKEALDNA